MRKGLLVILLIIVIAGGMYVATFNSGSCPLNRVYRTQRTENIKQNKSLAEAFILLKARKDQEALGIFEKTLLEQPQNLDALWAKAEVFRRVYDYKRSEELLNEVLSKNPQHVPSLNSLAYIRYKDDRLSEALQLIKQVLSRDRLDRENEAIAYIMLGTINSRRSSQGWLLNKLRYGTRIKGYFLKAKQIAPDLPETCLGLGTFYFLAPAIVGGNLEKAIKELELAVKIAPDFATVNVRLAQAYKKKGDLEKYNFYLQRAKALDPDNEVLKELNDK